MYSVLKPCIMYISYASTHCFWLFAFLFLCALSAWLLALLAKRQKIIHISLLLIVKLAHAQAHSIQKNVCAGLLSEDPPAGWTERSSCALGSMRMWYWWLRASPRKTEREQSITWIPTHYTAYESVSWLSDTVTKTPVFSSSYACIYITTLYI